MILSGTNFNITLEKDELHLLKDALELYIKLHSDPSYLYYIKVQDKTKIVVSETYAGSSIPDSYPLDVLLPLLIYKLKGLDEPRDPYADGDGSSYPAYNVEAKWTGLELTRCYVYAGK